jgi:hypothetical protein
VEITVFFWALPTLLMARLHVPVRAVLTLLVPASRA